MENWHILNLPFCAPWSISWKEQILCFNTVASVDSCLTGWFAVNAEFVDYCLPPNTILATSQMFLIQGFEANPTYMLWIWFFLPTWEAMQTGYFSCFGDKSKIREDLSFSSSCLRRAFYKSFLTAQIHTVTILSVVPIAKHLRSRQRTEGKPDGKITCSCCYPVALGWGPMELTQSD